MFGKYKVRHNVTRQSGGLAAWRVIDTVCADSTLGAGHCVRLCKSSLSLSLSLVLFHCLPQHLRHRFMAVCVRMSSGVELCTLYTVAVCSNRERGPDSHMVDARCRTYCQAHCRAYYRIHCRTHCRAYCRPHCREYFRTHCRTPCWAHY